MCYIFEINAFMYWYPKTRKTQRSNEVPKGHLNIKSQKFRRQNQKTGMPRQHKETNNLKLQSQQLNDNITSNMKGEFRCSGRVCSYTPVVLHVHVFQFSIQQVVLNFKGKEVKHLFLTLLTRLQPSFPPFTSL